MPNTSTNYRPFNLQTALSHPELIRTRDGRKVRKIVDMETGEDECIVVCIEDDPVIYTYVSSGAFYPDFADDLDLLLLPRKKTVWVNLYPVGTIPTIIFNNTYMPHDTEAEADAAAAGETKRLGSRAYPIEIEED